MTLLAEAAFDDTNGDTGPFEFIGRDYWGNAVRGRVQAPDMDAAHVELQRRGIGAMSVAPADEVREPYRVEIRFPHAEEPISQVPVGELVRRLLARRRAHTA